jgi:hypothetical protein
MFFIYFWCVLSRIWHSAIERHLFVPLILKEFHAKKKNASHHWLALKHKIHWYFDTTKIFKWHISVCTKHSVWRFSCIYSMAFLPFQDILPSSVSGYLVVFCFRISCCLLFQDILPSSVSEYLAVFCFRIFCCLLFQDILLSSVSGYLAVFCFRIFCFHVIKYPLNYLCFIA